MEKGRWRRGWMEMCAMVKRERWRGERGWVGGGEESRQAQAFGRHQSVSKQMTRQDEKTDLMQPTHP